MILAIESVLLCLIFTLMIFRISKDPVRMLYDYPPAIQERVKSLDAYRDRIPSQKNKIAAKLTASVLFVILVSLILRFVNGYTAFWQALGCGFLLWTVVNLYDFVVLDVIWFCHDPRFVIKGMEDMVRDYRDYWFHFRGFLTGEAIGLLVCSAAALIVSFVYR